MMEWTARNLSDHLGWQWDEKRQEYAGLCPCHESSGTHEYNAGIKDGRNNSIVFHCFGQCTYQDFIGEMKSRGIERPTSRQTEKREVERYLYTDEQGTTLYYNIRYDPKSFSMAQPGGKTTMQGVKKRVIYRLPTILETTHTVFFCEGEKDCHALESLGLTATCIAGGAKGWTKYASDYSQQLAGQDVVLLPHNDEPGRKFMAEVASAITPNAKRVRILSLPGQTPGFDAHDWLQGGGTVEQLFDLLRNLASSEDSGIADINANDLRKMEFKPLRWFASGILHEGMILFGGKSKRGKSWIALNMAISIATGGKVFGEYEVPEAARVLYCALEDGPRRTQRRIRQVEPEADLSNLKIAFRMPPLEDGGIAYIIRHIKEGYGVIVIDVLAHVESAGKNGLKDYHEVYRTFAPLQELRSKYPFALVMITHLRKSESEEVFDNLHGSVAYQGAQDALWVMERKQGEATALVYLRDKDAEDKTIELKFDGSCIWSFVGEGEEHTANVMESGVIECLREEGQPMSAKDIMQAMGAPIARYDAFRKRLIRMVSKGLLIRTDRGKYMTLGASRYED